MTTERRPYNPVEASLEQGAHIFSEFRAHLDVARERILGKVHPDERSRFRWTAPLHPDLGVEAAVYYGEEHLFVTDCPEKIFPLGPVYTVTSSIAYDNLLSGIPLMPAGALWGKYIYSHRGFSLPFLSSLMTYLRIQTQHHQQFVFAGTHIDAEQILYERQRAEQHDINDRQIIGTFFKEARYSGRAVQNLDPRFGQIIENISLGKKSIEDPTLTAYVEEVMQRLGELGVREGMYELIKTRLLEGVPDKHLGNGSMDIVFGSMVDRYIAHTKIVSEPAQAVVIKIDPRRVFENPRIQPLYPVIVGARNPENIVVFPFVTMDAITEVYAADPLRLVSSPQLPVSPISDLDTDVFIDGIRPESIKHMDPRIPLCKLRYARSPQSVWYEHAINGRIAPMFRMDLLRDEVWSNVVSSFGDRIAVPEGPLPISRARFITAMPLRMQDRVLRGVYT